MKEVYLQKYGINAIVIPHSVNNVKPTEIKTICAKPFTILFSGTIVPDRIDLLQQLVEVIGNDNNYHIRFLCPHDINFFIANGLYAKNISVEFIEDTEAMMATLKKADLLYLPLTFKLPKNSKSDLQLRSCLGTKSFDYMQTGVPILVHCPSIYLTYKYFYNREAAILLNSNDKNDLRTKLDWIRGNYQQVSTYARNAYASLSNNSNDQVISSLIKEIYDIKE